VTSIRNRRCDLDDVELNAVDEVTREAAAFEMTSKDCAADSQGIIVRGGFACVVVGGRSRSLTVSL